MIAAGSLRTAYFVETPLFAASTLLRSNDNATENRRGTVRWAKAESPWRNIVTRCYPLRSSDLRAA